jgi:hypothetical protein
VGIRVERERSDFPLPPKLDSEATEGPKAGAGTAPAVYKMVKTVDATLTPDCRQVDAEKTAEINIKEINIKEVQEKGRESAPTHNDIQVVITPEEPKTKESEPLKLPSVKFNEAVRIYTTLTGEIPDTVQRDIIATKVIDLVKWTRSVTDWMGHGWKKTNVLGIVDYYINGGNQPNGKPGASYQNSNGRRTTRREQVPESSDAKRQADQEKARQRIAARKAQEAQHAH